MFTHWVRLSIAKSIQPITGEVCDNLRYTKSIHAYIIGCILYDGDKVWICQLTPSNSADITEWLKKMQWTSSRFIRKFIQSTTDHSPWRPNLSWLKSRLVRFGWAFEAKMQICFDFWYLQIFSFWASPHSGNEFCPTVANSRQHVVGNLSSKFPFANFRFRTRRVEFHAISWS